MNLSERNFESEISFKSSRSGGKGGQNVNKVETKIELNFDVLNSNLLKDEERDKIFVKLKNRIDKNGILRIISQSERTQYLNKTKAISKFYELIEKALEKEKIRKKVILSKAEKEKRLTEKKKLSVKKVSRKINLREFDS
jgi:ribosome-associated protein